MDAPEGQDLNFFQKPATYVKAHPYRVAILMTGLVLVIVSVSVVPVLGAVGFEALGPGAGTAAASWQASIGLVEASSLFAWCQSAAMGGAALGGIQAVGAIGAATAGTALANVVGVPKLLGKFRRRFIARRKPLRLKL